MQALFRFAPYSAVNMPQKFHLRQLREAVGISLRELARQIDETPSNVSFWERTGTLPRSNIVVPMAAALGVSVEELLGHAKPKRAAAPGGRLRQLFERASKLPRRQQEKLISVLEPFVASQKPELAEKAS